jgi:alanine racemase
MGSRAWIEVNLPVLIKNLGLVRNYSRAPRLLFVIKSNAYGHGLVAVAKAAEKRVDFFGVASLDEGIRLRDAGIKKPILILCPVLDGIEIRESLKEGMHLAITHIDQLKRIKEEAQKLEVEAHLHLEIDTGMARTGIERESLEETLTYWMRYPYLRMESIFTHFPNAESSIDSTVNQLKYFLSIVKTVPPSIKPKIVHVANSASFLRIPESHLDMLRIGLILYGVFPSKNLINAIPVQPVLSLKTRVLHIREIKKGDGVSYGHTFKAPHSMRIATIGIGYGDGYPRSLSNIGEVLIHGRRAKIVGTVTMDLTMVDISHIRGVKVGDVVTLIGKEDSDEITAIELAEKSKTIPYEILCRIGTHLPHYYIEEEGVETLTPSECFNNLSPGTLWNHVST